MFRLKVPPQSKPQTKVKLRPPTPSDPPITQSGGQRVRVVPPRRVMLRVPEAIEKKAEASKVVVRLATKRPATSDDDEITLVATPTKQPRSKRTIEKKRREEEEKKKKEEEERKRREEEEKAKKEKEEVKPEIEHKKEFIPPPAPLFIPTAASKASPYPIASTGKAISGGLGSANDEEDEWTGLGTPRLPTPPIDLFRRRRKLQKRVVKVVEKEDKEEDAEDVRLMTEESSDDVWSVKSDRLEGNENESDGLNVELQDIDNGSDSDNAYYKPKWMAEESKGRDPKSVLSDRFERLYRKGLSKNKEEAMRRIHSAPVPTEAAVPHAVVDEGTEKGRGVQVTVPVRVGQFVCEYAGELVEEHEGRARDGEYAIKGHGCYLFFINWKGRSMCIDATEESLSLGPGRLINHKKPGNLRPELLTVDGWPRLCFFALQPIEAGEELGYDYGDRDPNVVAGNPWLS